MYIIFYASLFTSKARSTTSWLVYWSTSSNSSSSRTGAAEGSNELPAAPWTPEGTAADPDWNEEPSDGISGDSEVPLLSLAEHRSNTSSGSVCGQEGSRNDRVLMSIWVTYQRRTARSVCVAGWRCSAQKKLGQTWVLRLGQITGHRHEVRSTWTWVVRKCEVRSCARRIIWFRYWEEGNNDDYALSLRKRLMTLIWWIKAGDRGNQLKLKEWV